MRIPVRMPVLSATVPITGGHDGADPRQGDKDAHNERVAAKDVTGICDGRAVHAGEGKSQSDSTGQHQRKAVCEQDDAEKGENTRGQDPDDDSGGKAAADRAAAKAARFFYL